MNVVHRIPLAFHTPKADDAILYAGSAAHDLLIQATLDFRVLRMGSVHRLPLGDRSVLIAAPLIERDDGAYVALLDDPRPEQRADRDLVEEAIAAAGLAARRVSPDEIAREPLATTARVVWRQRHVAVEPGMRIGLLAAFAYEPTMTLHQLCSRVPGPRDPVFAVMALACEAQLHLDLSKGFDRETLVRGPR